MVLVMVCTFFPKPYASQTDHVLGLSKSSIAGGESWKDTVGLQRGAIMPVVEFSELMNLRVEANF